jgi:peptidoglycan/LPS O-acetylase OafA/YrhL
MKSIEKFNYQGTYRFFLALFVLWSHSLSLFLPEIKIGKLQLGNVAVSSFFVLSGYLMYNSINYWYKNKLNNFIINRYLRISPPLFLAAILSITIHYLLYCNGIAILDGNEILSTSLISKNNIIYTLLSPFFPFNIFFNKILLSKNELYYTFVRYSWAIFIEIIFYWFIYLAFKTKLFKTILILLLILFLISINNLYYQSVNILNISFINQFQWAPHFLTGIFISKISNKNNKIFDKLLFSVFAILSLFQLFHYAKNDYLNVISIYISINLLHYLIIPNFRNHQNEQSFNLDKKLGALSYPIYINQYALQVLIISLFNETLIPNSISFFFRLILYVLYNFIILCISDVLIKITDTYTDKTRDRLRGFKL